MKTMLAINNYHYRRGGAETVFLEQNRMFEEHGWQVVPFCMRHQSNLPSPWSEHFIEEIEYGSQYSLTEKISRVPKVIYSFEARSKLRKLLDVVRPDVCHGHNIYNHISPAVLSLLHSRGVPTVLTLHDLKIVCPAYTMATAGGVCERCKGGHLHNVLTNRCVKHSATLSAIVMFEAMLHRALNSYINNVSRFAVPSRFYINKLIEWGLPADKLAYVRNFVDATEFEPGFAPGDSFVYFGRLSPEKGLTTLVRAAAASRSKVTIAGTGSHIDELRALATSLSADVSFPGYLSGKPLHDLIRSARAVVLPSEWYENAPMSILEAYALGKPVLGARIGGIPELVEEEGTGHTFASGSAEDLTGALCRFRALSDASVETMGRAGREWVASEFTPQHYRDRLMSLYRDLDVYMDTPSGDYVRCCSY